MHEFKKTKQFKEELSILKKGLSIFYDFVYSQSFNTFLTEIKKGLTFPTMSSALGITRVVTITIKLIANYQIKHLENKEF